MGSPDAQAPTEVHSRASPIRRVAVLTAVALVSLNIWTGAPLLAVWIGSRLQKSSTQLSMGAVAAVVVVLAALCIGLTLALSWLSARYDMIVGRRQQRRRASWLKSLSGERGEVAQVQNPPTAVERVIVTVVVLAAVSFEVWFFFFAGSSLPNQ